jgi:hypothetical protein
VQAADGRTWTPVNFQRILFWWNQIMMLACGSVEPCKSWETPFALGWQETLEFWSVSMNVHASEFLMLLVRPRWSIDKPIACNDVKLEYWSGPGLMPQLLLPQTGGTYESKSELTLCIQCWYQEQHSLIGWHSVELRRSPYAILWMQQKSPDRMAGYIELSSAQIVRWNITPSICPASPYGRLHWGLTDLLSI